MDVSFKKLVRQEVLMVGERKIMFLRHPSYLQKEIANHRGTYVKHLGGFTCFHTATLSAALCVGFHIPWTSF